MAWMTPMKLLIIWNKKKDWNKKQSYDNGCFFILKTIFLKLFFIY